MYCIICKNNFTDRSMLNYTCRCFSNHAICYPCSESIRYNEARELFGPSHYLDVRQYHPDDISDWKSELEQMRKRHDDFKKIYIDPNTGDDGFINLEEITKTYHGEEHRNSDVSEKYDWTYKPEEVCLRWEKHKGSLSRNMSIIYQIKIPIDSTFTLVGNNEKLLVRDMKANTPFTLNLPIYFIPYTQIEFVFDPPVEEYEYTSIHVWHGYGESDPLYNFLRRNKLCIPSLNLAVREGFLCNYKKQKLSRSIIIGSIGVLMGIGLMFYKNSQWYPTKK